MPTTQSILRTIKTAADLAAREEDEAEPYKFKYAAADALKACIDAPSSDSTAAEGAPTASGLDSQHENLSNDVTSSSGSNPELGQAVAAARIRRGLILLDTDLLPDGEAEIIAGVTILEAEPDKYLAWLLESYNALGALYSQRGELQQALDWLQKAESLYQKITGTGSRTAHLPVPGGGGGPATAATDSGPGSSGDGPQGHANVTGQEASGQCPGQAQRDTEGGSEAGAAAAVAAAADSAPAAEPAAAGAAAGQRQAEAEAAREPEDAAQTGAGAGAAAPPGTAAGAEGGADAEAEGSPLHLLLPGNDAASVQSQYTNTLFFSAQVHGHMKAAGRSALYCAATLYRQLASGKYDLDTWVNNCLQLGGYYAKVHAFALAMHCHAAAKAVLDRDVAAGAPLAEDIAANVELAAGRLLALRLASSHARHVEGKELEMHYPDVSHFPDYLRFPGLPLPSPDTLPWGPAALAPTFEAARDLFNAAMPRFKAALSYYLLDGWVTDHVNILMDMSNMYRCLAGFEPDPGRAAAMHRCRTQLLEGLSGALNPQHYPGLSRSIDLELAHVWREVADIREAQGGAQQAKAASAAASAARYYQRFLASFRGEGGALPDRVDTDNEPYFLMASFGLGRMLHRMRGTGAGAVGAAAGGGAKGGKGAQEDASYSSLVVAAHQHLQWTSEYVKRHKLESWTQEAQAAEELSELLVEQMRLRAMTAARQQGR